MKKNNKKKAYLITSLTNGDINFKFLDSLLQYAKFLDEKYKIDTKIKIMPTKSFHKNCGFVEELDHLLVKEDFKINESLILKKVLQSDYSTNPISGVLSSGKSVIVAGITQTFKTLERQIKAGKLPNLLCATGSLNNRPHYLAPTKTNLRSIECFTEGALYVEDVDGKNFNVRQIGFNGEGFYDLLWYATPKRVVESKKKSVLVIPDLHPTETCPKSFKASLEMIQKLNPSDIILHDWFNAGTISHHIQNNYIKRANLKINLEQEVEIASKMIGKIRDTAKGMVHLVSSNHPEHLERYLDEGRYKDDIINIKYVSELIGPFIRGENIYKVAFGKHIKLNRINFLGREDVLQINGVELSNHGDAGINGSKSCKSIKNPNVVFGHTHSPEISPFGAMWVGTLTHLNLDYCNPSGYSSWLNSCAIVYPDGKKTLINIINGKWSMVL